MMPKNARASLVTWTSRMLSVYPSSYEKGNHLLSLNHERTLHCLGFPTNNHLKHITHY